MLRSGQRPYTVVYTCIVYTIVFLPAYQWWLNFEASVHDLQSFDVKIVNQTARMYRTNGDAV